MQVSSERTDIFVLFDIHGNTQFRFSADSVRCYDCAVHQRYPILIPKFSRFLSIPLVIGMMLVTDFSAVRFGLNDRKQETLRPSEINSQAEALFQEALVLSNTKEQLLGRLRFLEALRLWLQRGEPEIAARAALQMGDLHWQNKRYQEALFSYKQILEAKSRSRALQATACNAIARIYSALYQRDLSLRYYKKALDQSYRAKDVDVRAVALSGLVDLYYKTGDRERAGAFLPQARQLQRQLGNNDA
jgi:tetratricopeptide (TPR) repeat protein